MIEIQVTGLAPTLMKIRNLASEDKLGKIVEAAALQVEAEAKRICPVDTGRLRNSIATAKDKKTTAIVGTNVEYAPYVEFGTHKASAQPFLRPAAEKVKQMLPYMNFVMRGL